jgi:predicted nucleotidyltransferase
MYDMIDEQEIKQVAIRLGASINALRVILFGSYARGEANDNSDVDLMIIAESDLPRFKRSRELYKLFRPYPFGMDLVVYTPQEFERGKRSPVSFVSTVLREGKTLYVRRDRNRETVAGQGQE